jgi:hypothetical protein
MHVVTMLGESTAPRLTPDEIEALCRYRSDGKDLWKFWN